MQPPTQYRRCRSQALAIKGLGCSGQGLSSGGGIPLALHCAALHAPCLPRGDALDACTGYPLAQLHGAGHMQGLAWAAKSVPQNCRGRSRGRSRSRGRGRTAPASKAPVAAATAPPAAEPTAEPSPACASSACTAARRPAAGAGPQVCTRSARLPAHDRAIITSQRGCGNDAVGCMQPASGACFSWSRQHAQRPQGDPARLHSHDVNVCTFSAPCRACAEVHGPWVAGGLTRSGRPLPSLDRLAVT